MVVAILIGAVVVVVLCAFLGLILGTVLGVATLFVPEKKPEDSSPETKI